MKPTPSGAWERGGGGGLLVPYGPGPAVTAGPQQAGGERGQRRALAGCPCARFSATLWLGLAAGGQDSKVLPVLRLQLQKKT